MKAVLIGGGTGFRSGNYKLDEIDKKIVEFTDKDDINFLFVGFASNYSESYYEVIKKKYKDLGCSTFFLKKGNLVRNYDLAIEKINKADIIYFCGGDTLKLLEIVDEFNLGEKFKSAYERGCVMVGVSAGAILLCKEGLSDSYILRGESNEYKFIKGLGLIDICICPHYHTDSTRDLVVFNSKKEVYGIEEGTMILCNDQSMESFCLGDNHIYKIKNKKEIIL